MVPQAGMHAFDVVEALDVTTERGVQLSIVGEPVLVYELGLQRVKEALHVRVVLAVTRTIHAGHEAARAGTPGSRRLSTRCRGQNGRAIQAWDCVARSPA